MNKDFELKLYGKTQRFNSMNVTITEKIDGTNGCIVVKEGEVVGVQSRNRALVVGDDNFGFAGWVEANKEAIATLGDGYHYGEWAGEGIQKNPHKFVGKKFLLFNTSRPHDSLPDCVDMVPILYEGEFLGKDHLDTLMDDLLSSRELEGVKPEGIIIYWHSMRLAQKYTYQNNKSKWQLQ